MLNQEYSDYSFNDLIAESIMLAFKEGWNLAVEHLVVDDGQLSPFRDELIISAWAKSRSRIAYNRCLEGEHE